LRTPASKRGRPAALTVFARLGAHVTLEAHADGRLSACFEGHSVDLGPFSPDVADCSRGLRVGLPLARSTSRGSRKIDQDVEVLLRRLAARGLLEYRVARARDGEDLVVIEPQLADYWPQTPKLGEADILALSRFAYMRRRGSDMVLESPRSGALFKICDPKIATALVLLSTPQQIKRLRRHDGFPGIELLALLLDCQILFKLAAADDPGLRPAEGDDSLILWDFHDLLFHTRSTQGRHANPLGAIYTYAEVVDPLPAIRPRWPGKKIDLRELAAADAEATAPVAKLLRQRRSTRSFDEQRPITLSELARFLDGTARVLSTSTSRIDLGDSGPLVEYAIKPYPSAGAEYELELYLAVNRCDGLARGFYHYDASGHSLVPIKVESDELEVLLAGAQFAMGAPGPPQILITLAARFGRVSWKYSSIAYALILKDVGVMFQTFYLMATGMGLGGCAIGITNIDLFAKMTEIELHVEGPVGQFAIGREMGPDSNAPDARES
jgi:SagB-type dehydrogenase family enzyme